MRRPITGVLLLSIISTAGATLLSAGCESEPRERVVYREPVYTYEPGYYYDEGYYDTYHQWHPREYYYYDGRGWERRQRIPEGYIAHERHVQQYRNGHEEHEEHEEHEHHER